MSAKKTPAASAASLVTDEVTVKLEEFGASEEVVLAVKALGADTVSDLSLLTEADLVGAGMKPVQARKLLASLVPVVASVDTTPVAVNFDGVLPAVPDDTSWLAMLKSGGVLKVDTSTVISTIRAALANRVGLFGVPAKLADAMEKFADSNDEPVDPGFFALRKSLTRRTYAEVFEAIDGLDGTFVTEARKKALFERMDTHFWPALVSFNAQLKGWQDAWMQGVANPATMMMAMMGGGSGVAMPPGMIQAPDTAGLRDAADAVADAINKVFAGSGVPVAAAMAYDATQIRKSLEDSRLPALIGAANRDQMLRQLGVAVPATYPRLETNLTRYVLAVMQAKDQAAGNEELQYFGSLFMLQSQIPWETLVAGSASSRGLSAIGGGRL